jgi:hypothetical protein
MYGEVTMTMFRFFLDTDALNRLSRLSGKKLEEFKTRFDSINAELIVTHVQIDESRSPTDSPKDQEYQEIVEKALARLKRKGIRIRVETTNVTVVGIARASYSSLATSDVSDIYGELDKEIDACEKAKGKSKDALNIKRDAVIGVSPFEYSFLITTDKSLCDSFNKIIEQKRELIEKVVTPKAKRTCQSPEGVADCILEVFSSK